MTHFHSIRPMMNESKLNRSSIFLCFQLRSTHDKFNAIYKITTGFVLCEKSQSIFNVLPFETDPSRIRAVLVYVCKFVCSYANQFYLLICIGDITPVANELFKQSRK